MTTIDAVLAERYTSSNSGTWGIEDGPITDNEVRKEKSFSLNFTKLGFLDSGGAARGHGNTSPRTR